MPLPPSVPSLVLGPLAPSAHLSRGHTGNGGPSPSSPGEFPLYRNEWKESDEGEGQQRMGREKGTAKGRGWEAPHPSSLPQSISSSPSLSSSSPSAAPRPSLSQWTQLTSLPLSSPVIPTSSSSSPLWPSLSSSPSPSLLPSSVPSSHFSSPFHSSSVPSSVVSSHSSAPSVPSSVPMSPLVLPHRLSLSRVPPLPFSPLTGSTTSRRPSTAPSGRPSPLSSPSLSPHPFLVSPSLTALTAATVPSTFCPSPPHSFPSRRPSQLNLSGSASPVWSPCPSPPLPPLLRLSQSTTARHRPTQRRHQPQLREEQRLTVTGPGGGEGRGGEVLVDKGSASVIRVPHLTRWSFWWWSGLCAALLLSAVAVVALYLALAGATAAAMGEPLLGVGVLPLHPQPSYGQGRSEVDEGEGDDVAQTHHHSAHAREDAMLRQQVADFHQHMQRQHSHSQPTTVPPSPHSPRPRERGQPKSRRPTEVPLIDQPAPSDEVEKKSVDNHRVIIAHPPDAVSSPRDTDDEANTEKEGDSRLIHIVDADKWRH